jgi:hypothetical protein
MSCSPAYGWLRRRPTAESNILSVYYPFSLVDLVVFRESDDFEDTGEALLAFRDADGCEVTVRLSPHAVEALRKRISAAPDPHSK